MTCGCNNNNSGGSSSGDINVSGCGTLVPATPCGSSDCSSSCPEDHCQKIYVTQFFTTIRPDSSWNIPACEGVAEFTVTNLKAIPIGANIWSATYGYFEVVGFDAARGRVQIKNNCFTGNAAAGTIVSGCSEFLVTPAPCCEDEANAQALLFPYVALDFTAPPECPAVGCCTLITVTTSVGLSGGGAVQIGTGVYTVENIIDLYHITVCNNGTGIVPGTTVVALDPSGNYQHPLVSLDANPCNKVADTPGSLIVCKNGALTTLESAIAGSIPVVVDSATNEVEFQLLDVETRTCTELTIGLVLISGQATYILAVSSTAGFVNGDIFQIDVEGVEYRFEVTNVDAGLSQLTGTLSPTPGAGVAGDTAPVGTPICLITCCERLTNTVEDLIDLVTPVLCEPKTRFQIIPTAYGEGVTDVPGWTEATFNTNLMWLIPWTAPGPVAGYVTTVTSPNECDDATFLIEANLSVTIFVDYVRDGVPGTPAQLILLYSELQAWWDTLDIYGSNGTLPLKIPGRETHQWPVIPANCTSAGGYPVLPVGVWDDVPGAGPSYRLSFWRANMKVATIVPKNTTSNLLLMFSLVQDEVNYRAKVYNIKWKLGGYTKCTRIT